MRILALLFPFFLIMAACQEKTEVIRERVGNENTQGVPGSSNNGGVDSAGGDNGIDGRNMEDYAVNIQQDPAFTELVLPVILKVAEAYPRFASDMIHITRERTWYIVPVELNKLSASQIGVSFADKDVQQFALQNQKAIWVSRKFYKGFKEDQSRANLIMHEILMGVRLMKLKSSLDNCYSSIALMSLDAKKSSEYKQSREQCAIDYMMNSNDPTPSPIPGMGVDLNLEPHDYDNIRELGVKLWQSGGEVSKAEIEAWFKANNFRTY